ncbi:MAG: hypothetical protein ACWGQW_06895 [bacterium]
MAKKNSLTKANGKTKNEVEKFPVTGFEKTVPELRKIDTDIAALLKRRDELREKILDNVRKSRKHWEKKGKFYKTFVIQSADGVDAIVLFKNAFSKVDAEQEPEMREKLTDAIFDQLYEVVTVQALKSKPDWAELKKLLGKRADEFIKESKHISHRSEFMETRADLRNQVSTEINKVLDEYTESVQATPDLRLKG